MQGLDTTIVNVALPHIRGSTSASQDQISWVLTSYIVSAAIATPLVGSLADRLGIKYLLLGSVIGFTLASALCGAATSLSQLVLYRGLQGVFSAGLVPLGQTTLYRVYPRERHGFAMAIFATGAMMGPIAGPILGGWLTQDLAGAGASISTCRLEHSARSVSSSLSPTTAGPNADLSICSALSC
jgi:DHA2 family multidrug resistance protein